MSGPIDWDAAHEALESMDDFARMDVSVAPYGPYAVLLDVLTKARHMEMRARADERAEYWKQRAKAAEGHLFASDMQAAAKAVHRVTTYADTPWDELTDSVKFACQRAACAAIAAVNVRRDERMPRDAQDPDAPIPYEITACGRALVGGSRD